MSEDIRDRIALVRKASNKSQEDFGAILRVTKSTISLLETKKREPSERIIRDICREFSVNEDWLRTGAGGDENMFVPEEMKKYINIGKAARTPNEFRDFLIQLMTDLPSEYCDYLYNEFLRFAEEQKKKKENGSAIPRNPTIR